MPSIIIVDDDKTLRKNLSFYLRSQGYDVDTAETGEEAVTKIEENLFDVIVTDCRLAKMSGMELIKIARKIRPASEIIVITGYGTIPMAVEAIQNGAAEFICKPFEFPKILNVIETVLKKRETIVAVQDDKYDRIITKSQKMRDVLDLVAKGAATSVPVHIEGEVGTGKQLIARSIHARSERRAGNFVTIICVTNNENAFDAELFGSIDETGKYIPGAIAHADGGTLYLKDIDALNLTMQVRLLNFIQDGYLTFGDKYHKVRSNTRLICSSTKSLKRLVSSGHFREDLFYAINIMPIYVPPLRNRTSDIFPLVNYFLEKYSAKFNKEIKALSPDVLSWMQTYQWPGNVAELENIISRAVSLASSEFIDESLIFTLPKDRPISEDTPGFLNLTLKDNQKSLILKALKQNNGNYSRTAQQLGISRTTLWRRMKKFNIEETSQTNA